METLFGTPISCPVLIGRTAELTAIHLLIDRARSGKGQMVLLSGEAGIGKSRLVAEAKTYATTQGFLPLQGQCFPTDRSCPYAPLLDLLRTHLATSSREQVATDMGLLAAALSPLLPDLLPLASELPPLPSLAPEHEKRRLFATLAHLFLRQATQQPALLIVEDLHWSDQSSLDFLHYLARRCPASPLLVLLTYRSDEVHPDLRHFLAQLDRERLAQECALAPLSRSEVSAMLQAIFELRRSVFTVPPLLQGDLLDAMYSLTEGNPFFIEELLKSLIEAGDIVYEQGRWKRKERSSWHIPRSVQDAVELRIARLSEGARQVVQLAAVAGRHFDFALLQALTQEDEAQLLRLLEELIAAQLIVEESAEQFEFRHALTGQAVSAQLLVRERKALHRRIAETCERLYASSIEAHLADLASHFAEAEAWEQALLYGQRAGEQAQALYAPQAATLHFARALAAASQLSLTPAAGLYRARGLAYETLGDFERARADYETALQLADAASDRHAEWQALLDLGLLWAGRDYAQSRDYYQRALALARTMDNPAALAHSLNRLGNWHLNVEQPQEALCCHQEALATFQALSDRRGTAATLDLLGMASFLSGDLIQGTSYCQQAIVLLHELDDRQRLISSLVTLMMCGGVYETETLVEASGGFADSLHFGEQALKIAGEIGSRTDEAHTLIQMAMCLGPRGEYAHALEVGQRGLAIAEEIEHRQWMAAGHRALGALYLDLLALSEAKPHLEQALALAREVGSWNRIRIISGFLAPVYLLQRDQASADLLLTAALPPDAAMQTLGQRLVWAARADLALARDDPHLALHITDQLLASAVGLSRESSIPRLAKLRGEALIKLKQAAEAETILQHARTTALKHGLRPLLWRISLTQGKLAHAQRRYEEAERRFAEAQELLEDLASSLPDEPLQQHFLQHAQALFPRPRQPSAHRLAKKTFGGLTERERAVAALIALGKSNREIADTLVVAPHTIETHVSSILSKLGFTSRTQIAVWATEKGLSHDAM
jgi:DNA-binding CsgD family transcriptional regulator/tetratricopeptide (TPR) repeat protein